MSLMPPILTMLVPTWLPKHVKADRCLRARRMEVSLCRLNSLWSKTVGGEYNYQVNIGGTFDVYAWWTEWPSRSTSVPIQIRDTSGLISTVGVDQQVNGGQWNLIDSNVTFADLVRITIVSTTADDSTNADAIRLVPKP